ncbi:hypothetical protein ATERTT37_002195 [Aspergillus terreus]
MMLGEAGQFPHMGALLLTALFIVYLCRQWTTRQKILRLGGYAPRIPSYVPLAIRNGRRNKSLETWRGWHSCAPNNGTVEAKVLFERYLLTGDPENIKAILATQFDDFAKGQLFHDTWSQLLGDGIFSTDGAPWRGSRQLMRPLFAKDRVSDLDVLERHVQKLLRNVAAKSGQRLDLCDLLFRYTLDAATDFLLGEPVGSLDNDTQEFATAFDHAQYIQMMIARSGRAHVLIPRASLNKSISTINAFIRPYIDSALRLQDSTKLVERSEPDYTFLHALAHYTRDPKLIRDQLVNILIAGRDTAASSLSWVFFELAKQPRVTTKLREEILAQVGFERPTYSQLKDMKYLQNVIRETLRLYPIIAFNVRVAQRDTTLPRGGGPDGLSPVGVLKGTRVFFSSLYMQRRASLYPGDPNPDEFHPERWEKWQPASWQYIPFSGGPRICIGQQFALTEIAYTIVRLLQSFDRIEPCIEHMEPVLETNISMKPGTGVPVKLWSAAPVSNEQRVEGSTC